MKIVILGAGRVGASVAESLVSERNDITLIDSNAQALAYLQDKFDLRTLVGSATSPQLLRDAGIEDADILIATTASDETNLVACKLAAQLFNVPTRIARIRSSEFQNQPEITGDGGFYVDHLICPEQTVTDYLHKLVEFPEALQVLEFADGALSLIAVRAYAGGPLVEHPLRDLKTQHPNIDIRIVAIFRNDRSIQPDGDTLIEPGDEVFILAASQHIRTALSDLRRMDKPVRRIMIAGGGNIGFRLAKELASNYEVKIIDSNRARCEFLASHLPSKVIALHGDTTDEDLLEEENVREMDMFIALTSDDENNIMASMLAKRMGANRVIALINRRAYAELMQGSRIDIAITPALTTIGELLRHMRHGDVVAVHSLRRGAAEALEAVVHGDSKSSKVVGRRLEQIKLPKGATIGAIVRKSGSGEQKKTEVIMAHHSTVIEAEDHVIVFVNNKSMLPQLERLFQVNVGFF